MSAKAIELGLIGPALGQLPLDERATRGQVLQYIAFVRHRDGRPKNSLRSICCKSSSRSATCRDGETGCIAGGEPCVVSQVYIPHIPRRPPTRDARHAP